LTIIKGLRGPKIDLTFIKGFLLAVN